MSDLTLDPRGAAEVAREVGERMQAYITAELDGQEPYTVGDAAENVVAKLRANEPELLAAWLDVQATSFVRNAIHGMHGAARSQAKRAARLSVFSEATRRFAEGDPGPIRDIANGKLLEMPMTCAGSVVKPLGKLMRADLHFAAERYHDRARANAFEAAWLRAIAERVGDGTVEEVFSEAELATMRASLPGN